MTAIPLASARAIIDAALAKGAELGLKPLAVVVLDAGGHMIASVRQDGASLLRIQVATGKASGALALGISSRKIAEMAVERPTFVASLGPVAPAGVIPAAGGVIIVNGASEIIGAVGISGDLSDNDEICAIAGVDAAGLKVQA